MHANAYAFVDHTVTHVPRLPGLTVEIGGRNINGTIRPLFGEPYISVDLYEGPGVDVVADGRSYGRARSASTVVCCEVLEHSRHGAAICRNAWRILKPDGVFIVTAATEGRAPHSAIDGGGLRAGEYYQNVTTKTLRAWLAPFRVQTLTTNPDTADIYAVAIKR